MLPSVLRQALRQAGNIIQADEMEDVVSFIVSKHQVPDLDKLYLLTLTDGSVHQLRWLGSGYGHKQQLHDPIEEFYLTNDDQSRQVYNLMSTSTRLVQRSEAMLALSR